MCMAFLGSQLHSCSMFQNLEQLKISVDRSFYSERGSSHIGWQVASGWQLELGDLRSSRE